MEVTDKEYLLLSIMSYINFDGKHIGKKLYDILSGQEFRGSVESHFKSIRINTHDNFLSYFEKELMKWKLFDIDNRRVTSYHETLGTRDKTGFYSASFFSGENYVISFRGSEIYPIEEAYRDFMENNFALGIGVRPKQFANAVEFYLKHLAELRVPIDKLSITGHSLGGGIAQFVAISANKHLGYIPNVCTWNAVGVNREGVLLLQDFIDFDAMVKEKLDLSSKTMAVIQPFKEYFLKMLVNRSKGRTVNSNSQLRVKLKGYAEKFSFSKSEMLEFYEKFSKEFFEDEKLLNSMLDAQKFIENIKKNVGYEERIRNFGHSEDLTFGLFDHVGKKIEVDKQKDMKISVAKGIVKSLFRVRNYAMEYHFEEVFIPYIGEKGNLIDHIRIDFIASGVRKFIYEESGFEKLLLARYYSIHEEEVDKSLEIKHKLMKGIVESGIFLIYKKEILDMIAGMNETDFMELWKKIREKMPSPYAYMDIYDSLVYEMG